MITPIKAFFGTILAIVFLVALFTLACDTQPVQTTQTDNKSVQVDLLFTHDGCKVYRFEADGDKHYYVVCQKAESQATMYDSCRYVGKSCVPFHDEIPTVTQ